MDLYTLDATLIGRALQFIFIVTIVIAVVAYFSKRYVTVRVIKNVFAVILMIGGAARVVRFLFVLFDGHIYTDTLISSFIWFGAGALLWKWQVAAHERESAETGDGVEEKKNQ